MDRAQIQPGQSIIDIGCGCGGTTVELARRVGEQGRVLGIDVSKPMLAQARARMGGMANVTLVEADATTHPFEASYDLLFSRLGVMFFADPSAAFANVRRALRSGGRIAFVCWRAMAENPLMTVPITAAARHLPPLPALDPHAPGPFALADAARLRRLLETAGFGAIQISPHDEPIGGNDRAATLDLAIRIGPLGRALREHPDKRDAVMDDVRAAIEPFIFDGIARIPSATWIVTATT
jgi:SAM-dependent methyltransferase